MRRFYLVATMLVLLGALVLGTACNQNPFFGVGTGADLEDPELVIESPINGDFKGDSFNVTGYIEDDVQVHSLSVKLKGDSQTWTPTLVDSDEGTNRKTFTFPVVGTELDADGEGDKTLEFTATDKAGNETFQKLYITYDSGTPKVIITEPPLDTLAFYDTLDENDFDNLSYFTNGNFQVKGQIDDNFPVKSVTVNLQEVVTESPLVFGNTVSVTLDADDGTTDAVGARITGYASKWTVDYDVAAMIGAGSINDNKKFLVSVTTQDMAENDGDNSATQSMNYLLIKQDTDRPRMVISSPNDGDSLLPGSLASGYVFDDDGIETIYFLAATPADITNSDTSGAIDFTLSQPATWKNIVGSNYIYEEKDLSADTPQIASFTYNLPSASGDYDIYVAGRGVTDYYSFPSSTQIDDAKIYISLSTGESPYVTFGASPSPLTPQRDVITFTFNAFSNDSGKNVTSIEYEISDGSDTVTDTLTAPGDFAPGETPTVTVDFDSEQPGFYSGTSGPITVKVRCERDNTDWSIWTSGTYQIDNQPPTLNIWYPVPGETINSDYTIQGEQVGATRLYIWKGTNDSVATPADDADLASMDADSDWIKIDSPSTTWSYVLDSTDITATADGFHPLHIVAVDTLNNIQINTINIAVDQDTDKPKGVIQTPEYNEAVVDRDLMQKYGGSLIISGTANDDDGVKKVEVKLDFTNDAWVNDDVWLEASGTAYWGLSVEDLPLTADPEYIHVQLRVTDLFDRVEIADDSYFVRSDEIPEAVFLWPLTSDPEGDTYADPELGTIPASDPFGTSLSNVKDDIYWDGDNSNNDFLGTGYGWNSDLDESTLFIDDEDSGADTTRENYMRFIFKIKDNSNVNRVQFSTNNGVNYTTLLEDTNDDDTTFETIASGVSIKRVSSGGAYHVDGSGYYTVYYDYDLSALGDSSRVIQLKIRDDNAGTPYESISKLNVSIDNSEASQLMNAWGSNNPSNKRDIEKSYPYLGGSATDPSGGTGVRSVEVYFWNNVGTIDSPDYTATGGWTASVDSGNYDVDVESDSTFSISATGYPAGLSYIWEIENLYDEYLARYAGEPNDGQKLVVVKSTDNAGNEGYSAYELILAEYPPTIDDINIWWQGMIEAESPADPETGTYYVSGDLNQRILVSDTGTGADLNRIYMDIEDSGSSNVLSETLNVSGTSDEWNSGDTPSSTVDTTSLADEAHTLTIKVQDVDGGSETWDIDLVVDNTAPILTVTTPATNEEVAGEFLITGGVVETNLGAAPITIEILDGSSGVLTSWDIGVDGSNNFSQVWNTSQTPGYASVRITATDLAGNTDSDTVPVQVDASPPYISTKDMSHDTSDSYDFNFTTFNTTYFGTQIDTSQGVKFVSLTDIDLKLGITDADTAIDSNDVYLYSVDSGFNLTQESVDSSTWGSTSAGVEELNTWNAVTATAGEYMIKATTHQSTKQISNSFVFVYDDTDPAVWINDIEVDYSLNGLSGNVDTDMGAEDDVSGTIWIEGKAVDNRLLDRIQIQISGYNGGAFFDIATRGSTGIWSLNGNAQLYEAESSAGRGVGEGSSPSETLVQGENSVYWKFRWDTADIATVAANDVVINVRVRDAAGNETTSGIGATAD
jgi:hypothetical protein